MKIITDDIGHAQPFLNTIGKWDEYKHTNNGNMPILIERIFGKNELYHNDSLNIADWNYLLIKRHSKLSQYDIVNELYKQSIALPHGVLCVAGEGERFHGFKNRHWAAPPGNIYLTASFTPNCKIENFGVGFLTLAAVSVVEAIDLIPGLGGRASIKWVNDILIDGSKVCGVLAHTQQEGENVTSAVLGIGLNVLTSPTVQSTPFVPNACAISDFVTTNKPEFLTNTFLSLIRIIYKNYKMLLKSGYWDLLDRYRKRSIIIGRKVEICSDLESENVEVINSGTVKKIGEHLELYLGDQTEPVRRGRLVLKD